MNYGGNMPDWHQYNQTQSSRTLSVSSSSSSSSSSATAAAVAGQNVNGRVYMTGAGSPSLDGMNLSNERHRSGALKHPNDPTSYLTGRNYPIGVGGVHMSGNLAGCVAAHYTPTSVRNPMMEGLSPLGIPVPPVTEETVNHRNPQMGFAPPSNVNQGTGVGNGATVMGAIGSQGSPLGSASPGRPGINGAQSYVACKAPCCNPDPGIYHQHWEKYTHYPSAPYRDNVRQSGAYPGPLDARRFMTDVRKDCHENKDILETGSYPGDHRGPPRTFNDYGKYARKENLVARNYSPIGNAIPHQNYQMQNYQYSGAEYQKCPYTGKDYGRRAANQAPVVTPNPVPNKSSNMLKYHEQQSVIVQQKYQHNKQMQYQSNALTSNPGLLATAPRANANTVSPALQNPYYNTSRDYTQDYPTQDQSVIANRIAQTAAGTHVHGSFQKYHVYHQKIAMQRYSLENHLRAFSRIPGYQTHPKYQECAMRYRELLRLQQAVDYQNVVQESPKVPSPASAVPTVSATGTVAPINLQFDQNGVLINSSYIPSSGPYGTAVPPATINNMTANDTNGETPEIRGIATDNYENNAHYGERRNDDSREPGPTLINREPPRNENADPYYSTNEKKDGEEYEQRVNADREINESHIATRFVNDNEKRNETPDEGSASIPDYQNSKDFADKPELDVRQFLANWDESEDEETPPSPTIASANHAVVVDARNEEAEKSIVDTIEEPIATNADPPVATEILSTSSPETMRDSIEIDGTPMSLKNIREIECARSDGDADEIPTIHIVENLEDGAEIEKIHTVFGNLASAVLEPIAICEDAARIVENDPNETIVLFEQRDICDKSLEYELPTEKMEDSEKETIAEPKETTETIDEDISVDETSTEVPTEKNATVDAPEELAKSVNDTTTTTGSPATTSCSVETTSTTSNASSTTSNSSKVSERTTETTNLRKQNSFASDECHNPDDISLPDLQTSECTPISTTLNTPIHSDSEESTEQHRVTDLTISTNPIEIIQNSPIISFTHSPIKIEPYEHLERARMAASNDPVNGEHATLDFDFDEEVASNENRKYNETCDSSPESVVEELENQARDQLYEKRKVTDCPTSSSVTTRVNTDKKTDDYYRDPLVGMATLSPPADKHLEATEIPNENPGADLEINEEDPTLMSRVDDFNRSEDLDKLCDMSLDDSCIIPLIPDDEAICDEPRMPVSPMEGNCLTRILNDTLPITDLDMLDTSSTNEIIDKTNGEDDVWGQVRRMEKDFEGTETEARKNVPFAKPTKVIKKMEKTPELVEDTCQRDTPGKEKNVEEETRRELLESSRDVEKTKNQADNTAEIPEVIRDTVHGSRNKAETKSYSTKRHVDSNLEIQVANFNVKIHNDTDKLRGDATKNESMVEGLDAIEIKINLSRSDAIRRTGKNAEENFGPDTDETPKRRKNETIGCMGKIRCCRRRRSMPDNSDEFESKRTRRINADDHSTAKRLPKHRRNRKFRHSMDDKLLLANEERGSPENSSESSVETSLRDFRKELQDIRLVSAIRDDEAQWNDEKAKSLMRNRTNLRTEKLKDSRRLPSPSYNSSHDNSSTLDFDNFDVAPNRESDQTSEEKFRREEETRYARDKPRTDGRYGNSACTHLDDFSNIEALERNLNTVPIYTTKDGRITYSPNRNYTYRALIMEARMREKLLPSTRKTHHARSRNSYRDVAARRKFFVAGTKRSGEKKIRDLPHSRRTSSGAKLRHDFFEAIVARPEARSRKYESRRNATGDSRILTELESCRDEDITMENRVTKSRAVNRPEKSSERCHLEHRETIEVSLPEARCVPEDRADAKISEALDHVSCVGPRIIEIQEISSRSPKRHCLEERENGIIETMYQEQELEISGRKVKNTADCCAKDTPSDENCDASMRFFRENTSLASTTKTIMASPSTSIIEKRPQIWDLECQAALSDSGLESSTTYVEASKESRKLQKWKNTFVDRVDNAKSMFSVSRDTRDETSVKCYEAREIEDISWRKSLEKSCEITEKVETLIETIEDKIAKPSYIPDKNIPQKFQAPRSDETSEIVECLDLAIVSSTRECSSARNRRRAKNKRDAEIAKKISNESSELSFRRCVSNDGGEFTGLFFQMPKLLESSSVARENSPIGETIADVVESKIPEECHDASNAESKIFRPSCKDYLIDTCTSFSTCAKLPEACNETTSEITMPQLEDTSTRFASESMDFGAVYERTNDDNSVTSDPTLRACATSEETTGRDFFLSRLDENAIDPSIDSSRPSDDSGNSKDSRKAPILSFSGQIQSDSSLVDASSKSPPDITREIDSSTCERATNETIETSSNEKQSDFAVIENTSRRTNDVYPAHPKIPKMIIRNIKSRPGTPTASEDRADEITATAVVATKLEMERESSESKIPKMKIKLEDNQLPRMVVESPLSLRHEEKKNRSKRTSKSSGSRSPIARNEKLPLLGKLSRQSPEREARDSRDSLDNLCGSYKFTLLEKSRTRNHHRRNRSRSREKMSSRSHHHQHHRNRSRSREKLSDEKQEKIPKLTIKKQSSQSSNVGTKLQPDCPAEVTTKKRKTSSSKPTRRDDSRSSEKRRNSLDSNDASNNDSSLSEKVPKVIIKRASPSAEFKCELSKNDRDAIIRDSKWQPEVKLRRFWVLDCMAKEPGNGQVALKVLESTLDQGDKEIVSESTSRKNRKWNRSVSDSIDVREKIYEEKTRRRSDCGLETGIVNCENRRKSDRCVVSDESTKRHEPFSLAEKLPDGVERTRRCEKTNEDKTSATGTLKKCHESPDENNSVIKLDSSDESQTTIEMLPASPEASQLETNHEYYPASGTLGKLYSEDAIPTQFELELEIVDNSTIDSLDVPLIGNLRAKCEDAITPEVLGCERFAHEKSRETIKLEKDDESMVTSMRNVCCSDSLVKEVLAAKETLKRCLMTRSKSPVARHTKPRPKTAAEKKQGSSGYVVSEELTGKRTHEPNGSFQDDGNVSSRKEKFTCHRDERIKCSASSSDSRHETRDDKNTRRVSDASFTGHARSKDETAHVKSSSRSVSSTDRETTSKTTKFQEGNGGNSRTKGLSSIRKNSFSLNENKERDDTSPKKIGLRDDLTKNMKTYKIPKISRSKEAPSCGSTSNEANIVDANIDKRKSPSPSKMPILEPQIDLNFELAQQRESDRDTSRSPPVITKQEESLARVQGPKKIEDNVELEKLAGIEKQREKEAVTFADIVSQLAYHEKATIRHRRYCTLCERWFPTAARHRRHLTGYQHRHTELTQRRTVHALFMLFTGKPCPRLLPASIVRTDCLPGEPTPLQIAVQDVAISLGDGACVKPSKDVVDKDA